MDYEAIQGALQTIEIAKLFYDYGKLDRLLENGVTCTVEDPTFYFYEYWAAAADYVDLDFDDNHDVDHWYFSFRSMVEYYRLCRDYSTLHGIKLRKNPYVKKAEAMLADAFYNCSCSGGLGWGYAKKCRGKWSCGVIVETDCYFNNESELLGALLATDEWYTEQAAKLKALLDKEQMQRKRAVFRLEAA